MTDKTQATTWMEIEKQKIEMLKSEASDKIWFSVIALVSRRLVKGRPDFESVFRKIRDVIDSDDAWMKSIGRQVLRPVGFFMSECQPVDEEWRADHAALVDRNNPYWPNIITIGMGQADRPSVFEFATDHGAGRARPAHLLADGVTTQTVFQGILDQLPSNVLFQI